MAKVSTEVIHVLRSAARKIDKSSEYQWGHMGACNCGFLAQEVTLFSKAEIHQRAMTGHGDWTEQLNDYCPTSGLPMDCLISQLLGFGFDVNDLKHLERLSDPDILQCIPQLERNLRHNCKSDAVRYLRAWADWMEEEIIQCLLIEELKISNSIELATTVER